MQQIKGMLRDTWWLWLIFCVMTTFLVFLISPFFALIYPVLLVVLVYFALGRYDEHGQERQDF